MRLFIVDGAKALTKAIRRTFGGHTPIQHCQTAGAADVHQPVDTETRSCARRHNNAGWRRNAERCTEIAADGRAALRRLA